MSALSKFIRFQTTDSDGILFDKEFGGNSECGLSIVKESLQLTWTFDDFSVIKHNVVTDFSIADLAADARAPTPSAAAELISADQVELLQMLDGLSTRMTRSIKRNLIDNRVRHTAMSKRLRDPGFALKQQRASLQRLIGSMNQSVHRHIASARRDARQTHLRLVAQHPRHTLVRQHAPLTSLRQRLALNMQRRLKDAKAEATHKQSLLRSLGPEQILGRGYAIVTDSAGTVIRQPEDTVEGATLKVRLQRGRLTAQVTERSKD